MPLSAGYPGRGGEDGSKMKIVHLVTTDFGGAYKAVERIQECLKTSDVESEILVRSRIFPTGTKEVMNTPVKKVVSKTRNFINLLLSHGEVVTDLLGADLTKRAEVREADVIMLHWTNSFVSAGTVRKLAKLHKPIVWVMHDMWVFTGGCHYDGYCGRYETGCGKCPFLSKRKEKDISRYNLEQKKKLFDDIDIAFVAISSWEKDCAQRSIPLRGKSISRILNPVNTDIFRPLDREALLAGQGLGSKKIILFGADKATENPTKGFSYLLKALSRIDGEKYMAVCFGKAPESGRAKLPNIEIRYLGTVYDEKVLAKWYNMADVFVAPSLQEAFGYTVCEALSCGTPVTAFAVGGILDQIIHKENGFLAKLYQDVELAEGIEYCAQHRERLGTAARAHVVEHNSYSVIGGQYAELCGDIVRKKVGNL